VAFAWSKNSEKNVLFFTVFKNEKKYFYNLVLLFFTVFSCKKVVSKNILTIMLTVR
jgi:hypothetical protein